MVTSCAAWGCTNRQTQKRSSTEENRKHDITFHRFPIKNPSLLAKWAAAVKREHFKPTASHRLCSKHFLKSDFEEGALRRKLKCFAVPSVFSFPKHLQKPPKQARRILNKLPLQPISQNRRKSQLSGTIRMQALKGLTNDHTYFQDPSKKMKRMHQKVTLLTKKCKVLRDKARRRSKAVKRMKDLVVQLRSKHLIEAAAQEILEAACGGMSLNLFKHLLRQRKVHKNAKRYDKTVSKFAVTLHFLSPKAYHFIRPTLDLPHPSTLRSWKSTVDCEPGYLTAMLEAAQKHAAGGDRICSLVVDEMNLRKEVTWCPTQHTYRGHVDYRGGPVNDTEASNALVFMLVSMKKHWKTPIAYFLTDHVDSETLANCITDALMLSAEHGLLVKTVVADGLKTNMKAARILGCELSAMNPKVSFVHPHPTFKEELVYFICDPPHMLKLVRNLLAEYGNIYSVTSKGRRLISWQFIKALHDAQSEDSLYLANKLRSRHVHYRNVKIKVNIAAQTLSLSVAVALDHLRDDLGLPQFQNSEETSHFIRLINNLFDVLNSKNPVITKGYKAPLSFANRVQWEGFLSEAVEYLLILQDSSGRPLHQTPRGQAITGFIVTATAIRFLADDMLIRGMMRYLLTYKVSQDHIEMYFSKICQRGGWNNNPTAEQFRAALRTLMVQNDIKASEFANSLQLDDTQELQLDFSSFSRRKRSEPEPEMLQDETFLAAVERLESTFAINDADWRYTCLAYTAGFVTKRVASKIKCATCRSALSVLDPPTDIYATHF